VGYGLLAVLQVLTQLDVGALYVPLAVLQGTAVVVGATLIDLYLIVLLFRRARRATSWRALAPLAAAALVVAMVKLSALTELLLYVGSRLADAEVREPTTRAPRASGRSLGLWALLDRLLCRNVTAFPFAVITGAAIATLSVFPFPRHSPIAFFMPATFSPSFLT